MKLFYKCGSIENTRKIKIASIKKSVSVSRNGFSKYKFE